MLTLILCSVYKLIYWIIVEKKFLLTVMEMIGGFSSQLLIKTSMLISILIISMLGSFEMQFIELEVDIRKWVIIFFLLSLSEEREEHLEELEL